MNIARTMLEMLTGAYNRTDLRGLEKGLPPQTNIGRLFSLFGWGMDLIRDHAERVKLWDDLDNAKGAVLDRYGENFGVRRGGTEDGFYRLMIQVKMLSQLSGGDINTVIQAAASLFHVAPEDVKLEELFPAKIWLRVNEDLLDDEHMALIDLIAQLNKRILAAGIGMKIILEKEVFTNSRLYVAAVPAIVSKTLIAPRSAIGSRRTGEIKAGCCPVQYTRLFIRPSDNAVVHRQSTPLVAACGRAEIVKIKIPAYRRDV